MKNTAGKFILKNFVKMVLLIFAVSIAAFALMTVSPVDPLQANVGQAALGSMSQEQIAQLEEYWGVNTPPVKRYVSWAADFLRGDMGTSLLYRQPDQGPLQQFLRPGTGNGISPAVPGEVPVIQKRIHGRPPFPRE